MRALLPAGALAVSAVLPAGADEAPAPGPSGPVLVELFTSQGCSSCPPADRLLGTVIERGDVVALSFHVDYWDYLGWRDTFADPAYTRRQFAYRDAWRARVVYTPQMVIGGVTSMPGNRADEVTGAIDAALAAGAGHTGAIVVESGQGMAAALLTGMPGDAVVYVARYDKAETVDIRRGENAERMMEYRNVVRDFGRMGTVAEVGTRLPLPMPAAGEGVAVWVQAEGHGRVLAAVSYEPLATAAAD
ncbi:MAG: DUF1223 domain-containing protein [Pseudomonadota bacterium]